jgi:hypothetical protein
MFSIPVNDNVARTLKAILIQVGEEGTTKRADLAPYSTYTNKAVALRAAYTMGYLIDNGEWVEATDATYDWLAANVAGAYGR